MVGTIYYDIYLRGSNGGSTITGNQYFTYRVTGIRSSIPSGSSIGSISSITLHFNKLQNLYQQVEFMLYENDGKWYDEWMADHDGDLVTIQKNQDGSYDYTFTKLNPRKLQVQFNVEHSGPIHFLPESSNAAFQFTDIDCRQGYIAISYNYTPPGPSSGSSISLASNTITLGGTLTYSITGDSRCTHTVTASLDGTQLKVQQTGVSTGNGKTITIPNSQQDIPQWVNALPNSVTGNCTITLTTSYNGSQIGSTSLPFYVRVPDSYKPTLSSLGISMVTSPYNATVAGWGLYVQGISKARLAATGASGSYGSTIKYYHFLNADGTEITKISANSGNVQYDATLPASVSTSFSTLFKCYVEDSRGRTSNTVSSSQIVVYKYNIPALSAVSAIRCNASGIAQEDGTYFKLSALASFTSIGGKNLANCTRQIQWKSSSESSWHTNSDSITGLTDDSPSAAITATIGSSSTQSSDYIVPNEDYKIKVTVTDKLGGQASREIDLGTISYTMFFKKNGLGVAIGQPTKEDINTQAFEVNPEWAMIWGYLDNNHSKPIRIPGVIYTDKNTTLNNNQGRLGMVWLKAT